MKKFILIVLCFICFEQINAQDYETLYKNPGITQTVSAANFSTSPALNYKYQEVSYISDNISCMSVRSYNGIVYLAWNVCDDTSNSEFFIVKTQGETHTEIARIKNHPNNIGMPILYSAIDTSGVNTASVYKLFKITSDGSIKHIITVLMPKPEKIVSKVRKKYFLNLNQK